MFCLGLLLGFVGAGGAGTVIAVLTTCFAIPIHTALGTSLAAMVFTCLSGSYSHFREKNMFLRTGLAVGLFGALGAFAGAKVATIIPGHQLKWLTAGMLFLSAFLLWLRIQFADSNLFRLFNNQLLEKHFWPLAAGVGCITGMLSGTFGIGAAPFIQISLLVFFRLTLPQVAGTTMLVILPIAFFGGLGYLSAGYLDIALLFKVVIGMVVGAYLGAKWTNRLPPKILKIAMVAVPVFGAIVLLFAPQ
jgi:hypothetical protein